MEVVGLVPGGSGFSRRRMRLNMSIDADPQQQAAAPPQVVVVRSSSR
jgi:hypothetical protein